MFEVELRTIRQKICITLPDPSSHSEIRFIDARPQVEGFDCETSAIVAKRSSGFLELELPTGYLCEGTAGYVLGELHRYHMEETRREFPGRAMLHGGTVTTDEGHTVVIGAKGAGKTTLLLHLAAAGWNVPADEHIIIDGAEGVPRPRTLRVKEGSLPVLGAAISDRIRSCPAIHDWSGLRVYAVPPDLFGGEWAIRSARIANIVFLEPNHGGRSDIRDMSVDEAFEIIFRDNVILPESGKAEALAALRNVLLEAKLWRFYNGELDHAERVFYSLIR